MARRASHAAPPVLDGRAIGYTRVSTLDQAEHGQSLATQQRQIEGWAQMMGLKLDRIVVEGGVSGGTNFAERPEGSKLMAELQAGDLLVCSKLDRFSRDLFNCLAVCRELHARHVRLFLLDVSATDAMVGNGIGNVVMSLLGTFAQFERERIAIRIKEAKAGQRERGEWLGGLVPFGLIKIPTGEVRKDKPVYRLAPDPEQQRALRRILKLHRDGLSSRAIAADLAERGVKLSHITVQKICAREEEP